MNNKINNKSAGRVNLRLIVNKETIKKRVNETLYQELLDNFGQKNLCDIWHNLNKPNKFFVITTFDLPECNWEKSDVIEISVKKYTLKGKEIVKFNCEKHNHLNDQLPVFIQYKNQNNNAQFNLKLIDGLLEDDLYLFKQRLKKSKLK